ncbi:SGNH/GDSL hydrolase family protein [Phycicoccus sp. CSK15P-2]|uniref:SGNH/GDSL hydrolase family protein n=1 Tax=Phycicoccus sp. CSK15P-2 TaxID=2807627 RepID=UPI00195284AC|nr:SGNH/GDSL hydrolase family protein [Phycicoccus sp. CSK15P-2]MBM6405376.1 SGNH/GDSL hydrolase family protein [Phycicoccus sp. CSK15P-2]
MARRRALVTAALASVTALVFSVAPAQAAPPSYVALGDSYSSGTGTRSYIIDGTDCLRSVYAYPSLIATSRQYALTFRACSGATVADVRDRQLSALGGGTSHVTISVGGNDAGFTDVITECALPSWISDCYREVDRARAFISGTLPSRLEALYTEIRARAPRATVTVVGYPRLFNGEDCNALTWFSPSEESRINAAADLMNSVLAEQASDAGFSFADPTSRFLGHAVCDDVEWINGLTVTIVESFHPNKAGHASGYTPTVSPYVTGTTVQATPSLMREAAAGERELAADLREYSALDRGIEPRFVRAPDLDSPRARKAAKRAGVDLDSRASIDAADRRYEARQRAAHPAR